MNRTPPYGGWPPAPGLDKEEPELQREDDIPRDESSQAAKTPPPERPAGADSEDRTPASRTP